MHEHGPFSSLNYIKILIFHSLPIENAGSFHSLIVYPLKMGGFSPYFTQTLSQKPTKNSLPWLVELHAPRHCGWPQRPGSSVDFQRSIYKGKMFLIAGSPQSIVTSYTISNIII